MSLVVCIFVERHNCRTPNQRQSVETADLSVRGEVSFHCLDSDSLVRSDSCCGFWWKSTIFLGEFEIGIDGEGEGWDCRSTRANLKNKTKLKNESFFFFLNLFIFWKWVVSMEHCWRSFCFGSFRFDKSEWLWGCGDKCNSCLQKYWVWDQDIQVQGLIF